jgi:alanine racemase
LNQPFSYRDSWAEINLDQIEDNVKAMKRHLPEETAVMAVVKANGYGHGAVQVARTAIAAGAKWLGVALLDEALVLRQAGIDIPILVLGWVSPEAADVAARNEISLTVFQRDWLVQAKEVYREDALLHLHLKLDTGMGRLGERHKDQTKQVVEVIRSEPRFQLEGVYTHFATADELDLRYFIKQYDRFLQMLSWLEDWSMRPPVIHCGNSATGLRFPGKAFSLVRFGISMYGLSPSEEMKPELPFTLKQAFNLHSRLTYVKQLESGEGVSYGAAYVTKEKEWIGTVPLGYADGWLRQIAKKGEVLVNGERAPIVGKICMDQFMVRLPREMPIGARVTLIGTQGTETISVDDIARQLNTINYEVPCTISYRVPRVYLKHQEVISADNMVLCQKSFKRKEGF